MTLLDLSLVLPLAFSLRFLFFLGMEADQNFHLLKIKWIQRDGWKRVSLPDSIIPGNVGYPALPHLLIGLFPKRLWVCAGKLLNITYDLIAVIVVYAFSRFALAAMSPVTDFSSLVLLSPAGWATLIYATSPILHPLTARLKGMGGRTMGLMFVTAYFSVFGYAYVKDSPLFLILCVPLGLLTILSSIFARQVLILFSFFLSVFLLSPVPFLMVIAVVLIGLLFPPLGVKQLFVDQYHHFYWYLKNLDRGSPVEHRNRLKNILSLPRDLFRKPKHFFRNLFANNSFFIALYSLPPLAFVLYIALSAPRASELLLPGSVHGFLWAMTFSGVASFLMTSFRPFLILGEAERYLEYAAPSIYLLFVANLLPGHLSEICFLSLIFHIVVVLINFFLTMGNEYTQSLKGQPEMDLNKVLEVLKQSESPRILTIPTKLAYLVAGQLDHPRAVYCYDWISEGKIGFRYMLDEWDCYQYPKADLSLFMQKYGINTLVINTRDLKRSPAASINYRFEPFKLVAESGNYQVYKVF